MNKCCILYLVNNTPKCLNEFRLSLQSLDLYFNKKYQYPIIVLHESLTILQQEAIRSYTSSKLLFSKVEFDYNRPWNQQFPIGYCNMCRFFAGLVQDHPSLAEIDYYWRLDTDSFILGSIEYDVFQFMQDNNKVYGYITTMPDQPHVLVDFWQTTINYLKEYNVTPINPISEQSWNMTVFYNNFEIVKLDFLRSKEYQSYFRYLDNADGYFMHRWGDHATRYVATKLFLNDSQIHQFTDVKYQHSPFVRR